ncbi:hypothetical protein [Hymenobacter cellulosivorans]|uniref:Lipoprotein n=1 Tax=Hymenobacter cellulosivorans TaxID=2932249 RepID=A0ABY4FAC9_9BACT|nr:hypothetical protein [Hymenobacter cellulosivorans]UOQ53458.1 hypothetical protein MUN80_01555 [Hymenobacter cellulosivorans]
MGTVLLLASCEQTTVAPTQPRATATTQRVEVGDKIINPVAGTEQTAGRLIDWRWGRWDRNCGGAGICYIRIWLTQHNVAEYPVVGEGTGFLSAPVNVDPKTSQGTIRIIFTKQQENIDAEKLFTVAKEGTTFDDETAHAFGYSQVVIQAGDYPIIHGDGSATNPFGYVDVTAACK